MPRNNASFMKPQQPDAVLGAVIGTSAPLPRPEITKRIWAYIKTNGLQDAKERRQINAGTPAMRELLGGRDHCTMFELQKFVNPHVSPIKE